MPINRTLSPSSPVSKDTLIHTVSEPNINSRLGDSEETEFFSPNVNASSRGSKSKHDTEIKDELESFKTEILNILKHWTETQQAKYDKMLSSINELRDKNRELSKAVNFISSHDDINTRVKESEEDWQDDVSTSDLSENAKTAVMPMQYYNEVPSQRKRIEDNDIVRPGQKREYSGEKESKILSPTLFEPMELSTGSQSSVHYKKSNNNRKTHKKKSHSKAIEPYGDEEVKPNQLSGGELSLYSKELSTGPQSSDHFKKINKSKKTHKKKSHSKTIQPYGDGEVKTIQPSGQKLPLDSKELSTGPQSSDHFKKNNKNKKTHKKKSHTKAIQPYVDEDVKPNQLREIESTPAVSRGSDSLKKPDPPFTEKPVNLFHQNDIAEYHENDIAEYHENDTTLSTKGITKHIKKSKHKRREKRKKFTNTKSVEDNKLSDLPIEIHSTQFNASPSILDEQRAETTTSPHHDLDVAKTKTMIPFNLTSLQSRFLKKTRTSNNPYKNRASKNHEQKHKKRKKSSKMTTIRLPNLHYYNVLRSTKLSISAEEDPNQKLSDEEDNPTTLGVVEMLSPYSIEIQLQRFAKLYNDHNIANVTVEVIGRTIEYNNIVLLKITEAAKDNFFRGRESKFVDEKPEKKIIFIVHGLTVAGIRHLIKNEEDLTMFINSYLAHLDKFDFFVIPVANPDGLAANSNSQAKAYWNKNMSPQGSCAGVVLDRNFDIAWNTSHRLSPCSHLYPGRSAFSEPETVAIKEVMHLNSHRIEAYIHVHASSYKSDIFKGDAILYPQGYSDFAMDDDKYIDLKAEVEEAMKNASFKVISVTVESLYSWYGKVTGSSVDYAASVYGIPFSMEFAMQLYDKIQKKAFENIWKPIINITMANIWKGLKSQAENNYD